MKLVQALSFTLSAGAACAEMPRGINNRRLPGTEDEEGGKIDYYASGKDDEAPDIGLDPT